MRSDTFAGHAPDRCQLQGPRKGKCAVAMRCDPSLHDHNLGYSREAQVVSILLFLERAVQMRPFPTQRVRLCVAIWVSCANTPEPIEMPFGGGQTIMHLGNLMLNGWVIHMVTVT